MIPRGQVEVYTDAGELVGSYRTTALPPGNYTLVPVVSPAYAGSQLTRIEIKKMLSIPSTISSAVNALSAIQA